MVASKRGVLRIYRSVKDLTILFWKTLLKYEKTVKKEGLFSCREKRKTEISVRKLRRVTRRAHLMKDLRTKITPRTTIFANTAR